MADRLPPVILNALKQGSVNVSFQYQAWIKGTAAGTTEITDYVLEWSDPSEMELYNRHPAETGSLAYVTQELEVNNTSGIFTIGNASGVFPGGSSDFDEVAQLEVKLSLALEGTSIVVWDHTGILKQPKFEHHSRVLLFAEHPLNRAEEAKIHEITKKTTHYVNLNV